jgi:hypothetical protein
MDQFVFWRRIRPKHIYKFVFDYDFVLPIRISTFRLSTFFFWSTVTFGINSYFGAQYPPACPCMIGLLHAKIEKVANTMPKRGIYVVCFLVENRNFCSKFIEIIGPNEFDRFFKKRPTTEQKVQKRGKCHASLAMSHPYFSINKPRWCSDKAAV